MAHYLVSARPVVSHIEELKIHLGENTFRSLKPFGNALTDSLLNARINDDTGIAQWEEEDYCTPPLAEERAAVLDTYFTELKVERVGKGEGWKRLASLPRLFEAL